MKQGEEDETTRGSKDERMIGGEDGGVASACVFAEISFGYFFEFMQNAIEKCMYACSHQLEDFDIYAKCNR